MLAFYLCLSGSEVTPNARSKAYYEKQGHLAVIVEHWSPFPKPFGKRHDFLGVFDLLVLKAGGEVWGIQATTNSNVPARLKKMRESDNFWNWLKLGGKAAVLGWGKKGERGKRKTWEPKEIVLAEEQPPSEP